MTLKHILIAAAATTLMAGVAQAQDVTQPSDQSAPSSMPMDKAGTTTSMPDTDMDAEASTSSSTTMPMASTGMTTDASASLTTTTVTNGPVADTPENRAKYRPLSRAGNRTAARGN